MASPRRSPYVYVTWLTPLLAGDAQCEWAPWFKSHFKHDKRDRGGFDLAKWKAEHGAMVTARATVLRAEGWDVSIEDQNAFTICGAAATLAGKPDLVAVRATDARIIDCKSGQRRASDVQQVLVYMLALPLQRAELSTARITGELQYRDGAIAIPPEDFTPDLRGRIAALIRRMGESTPPPRVPSPRECAWCDIGPADCPDRVEQAEPSVVTTELF